MIDRSTPPVDSIILPCKGQNWFKLRKQVPAQTWGFGPLISIFTKIKLIQTLVFQIYFMDIFGQIFQFLSSLPRDSRGNLGKHFTSRHIIRFSYTIGHYWTCTTRPWIMNSSSSLWFSLQFQYLKPPLAILIFRQRNVRNNYDVLLKFIYSEKAKNVCKISTLLLTGTT